MRTKKDETPEGGPLGTLDKRLRHALDERQMSQKRLEEAAGLSRGYVTRILKRERVMLEPPTLEKIATALSVGYEWLATGRGELDAATSGLPAARPGRFPALDAAIAYHRNKWSALTVVAARAVAAEAEELDPPAWAELLDQIEGPLSKLSKRGS